MLNKKSFLTNLTTHPGVYQMLDGEGKVLYVGKARNLKKRVTSYFTKRQDVKTQALMQHVADIRVIVTHNELEAFLLESNLIKKFKPHYNVLFRDDKSYPYIIITDEEPYPCIAFYRGNKKKGNRYFGPYPNADAVRETIHLIQKVFGLRTCHDRYSKNRERPCLQYQIGLCSGACAGLISKENYQQDIEHAVLFLEGKNDQVLQDLHKKMDEAALEFQYERAAKLRDQIAKMRSIHSRQYVSTNGGDVDVIGSAFSDVVCIQLLIIRGGRILGNQSFYPTLPAHVSMEEVITSFITQHYLSESTTENFLPKEIILPVSITDIKSLEQALSLKSEKKVILSASVRGERKKWLEMANTNAKQALVNHMLTKTQINLRLEALQNELHLKKIPERIECFDISHTMGEAIVASCVVFNRDGPVKSDYRRFNIKGIKEGDDVAAIQQVILRRYQRMKTEEGKWPDLIMVDGGKQQLNAAQKSLLELNINRIPLISIAKGVTRKPGLETIHSTHRKPFSLPADSFALHLIQQIRDEAHRFAITGHRMQRDKKRHQSILETIPGIGLKRRRELLRYFGGIQAINRASLEELTKVPGISQSLAERIFSALHDAMVK